MRRMWINQPSTSQQFHALHGRNVLAEEPEDNGMVVSPENVFTQIWFTSGSDVGQFIREEALSKGWTGDQSKVNKIQEYVTGHRQLVDTLTELLNAPGLNQDDLLATEEAIRDARLYLGYALELQEKNKEA